MSLQSTAPLRVPRSAIEEFLHGGLDAARAPVICEQIAVKLLSIGIALLSQSKRDQLRA
jgi:hypothetical protein